MNRPNRHTRRKLEAELRSLPSSPPPEDLLAKLKAEIPEALGAANAAEAEDGDAVAPPTPAAGRPTPPSRFPYRLAASLAVAALGGLLAWQMATRVEPEKAPAETHRIQQLRFRESKPAASQRRTTEAPPLSEEKRPSKGEGADASRPRQVRESTDGLVATGPAQATAPAPAEPRQRRELEDRAAPAAPLPSMEKSARVTTEAEASLQEPRPQPPDSEELAGLTVLGEAPAVEPGAGAAARPDGAARRREADAGRRANESARSQAMAYGGVRPEPLPPTPQAPSTGGTREPLEQPVGDMFFRAPGTNPFVDTAEDALSTFALDVDTGSYTLARSYIDRGALPPAEAIRVEEFVNAQAYEDPAPRRGEFTLTAEGAPSPFAPGGRYRILRFAVRAQDVAADERKSAVLTFVVDVSGSMARENRLELVKRALDLLLDELRPDDRVGLVVYGTNGRVLLSHTRDHEAIRDAIRRLSPEGSTNAEEGLRLAYDLADRGYRGGAINRIVLCSDGVANVGATGPESILARIGAEARRGIALTTVGFGMGNYNDALMEQLADQGDGAYHYVDTLDEARRVFVENLTGTLQTVAKDAKVQVEFDPRTVDRWRLLGYENRDVADRDFRNDRIDAGEVGVGTAATALYEVRLVEGARGGDRVATLRLRWKSVEGGRVVEAKQDLAVADLGRSFQRATRDLRVAAVAAELAERLKGSFYARESSWEDLRVAARALARDERQDESVARLAELVERAARLAGPRPPQPLDDEPEED